MNLVPARAHAPRAGLPESLAVEYACEQGVEWTAEPSAVPLIEASLRALGGLATPGRTVRLTFVPGEWVQPGESRTPIAW